MGHKIHRAGGVAVALSPTIDDIAWEPLLRVETENYRYGHLLISAEIQLDLEGSSAGFLPVSNFPHVEVRVIVWYGLVPQIWFEGALGNIDNPAIGSIEKSAGPISLPFLLGEVPDSIEVFARGRKNPNAVVTASDIFTATAVSRFVE